MKFLILLFSILYISPIYAFTKIEYQYAPASNSLLGSFGMINSIPLYRNWELTNRYRFVYNYRNRQDHLFTSGLTYRF